MKQIFKTPLFHIAIMAAFLGAICIPAATAAGTLNKHARADAELKAALGSAGDPALVNVMTNSSHVMEEYALSPGGRYMFTANNAELAVWDRASLRIIRRFPIRGIFKMYPHPTEEGMLLLHLNQFSYGRDSSPLPVYLIDWQTGKLVAHLPPGFTLKPNWIQIPYETFVSLKPMQGIVPLSISDSPDMIHNFITWQSPAPLGSVTTNPNDSLLLVSGPWGLVWDLRRARTSGVLRLHSHLRTSDTILDIPPRPYHMLPKPKTWKMENRRSYINRGHYEAFFDTDGTILTGSPNGKLFRYDSKGTMLDSIVMPGLVGPVFSASRHDNRLAAATLNGVYVGTDEMRLPMSFDPYHAKSRNSEDGMANLVSRSFGNGKFISSFPRFTKQFVGDFDGNIVAVGNNSGWGELTDIKISPDEKYALGTNGYSAAFFDLTHTDSLRLTRVISVPRLQNEYVVASEFLPDGKIAIASELGYLFFAQKNRQNGEFEFTRSQREHLGKIQSVAITNDSTKILTADTYGQVTVWNARAPHNVIVKIFNYYPGGVLAVTPDQYYSYESFGKPLARNAHFVKDNRPYNFDQFDLARNRPDIIVERLGGSSAEVDILRRAWKKRLSRAGISEKMLADDYHTPEAEITNRHQLPVQSDSRHAKIQVRLSDTHYPVERVMLSLNGVPLLGDNGRRVEKNENPGKMEFDVELTSGSNLISVTAVNSAGTKSLADEITIKYNPPQNELPRLWILSVGVSEYLDSGYRLNYAAKDSRDFIDIFSPEKTNAFSEIKTMSLTDSEFDIVSIERMKEFLAQAKRDDVAIAFFAGHGVLDSSLDYYLAPADIDFSNPSTKGVSMEKFTSIFDSTKALRRYLFVDACHSGGVDKEEFIADNSIELRHAGNIRFRNSGTLRAKSAAGLAASQLADDIFSDLTTSAGATLISASAGNEQALEGVDWQNGVFTYLLKEAMNDATDLQTLTIEQMAGYVRDRVPEITNNAQHPRIRTVYPSETVIFNNR